MHRGLSQLADCVHFLSFFFLPRIPLTPSWRRVCCVRVGLGCFSFAFFFWSRHPQAELGSPPRQAKVTRKYRAQQKGVRRLAAPRSASPPGRACQDAEALAAAAWWAGRTREVDPLAVAKARHAATEVRRQRHHTSNGDHLGSSRPPRPGGGARQQSSKAGSAPTRRRAASGSRKRNGHSAAAEEPLSPPRGPGAFDKAFAANPRAATAREIKEGAATYVPAKAKKTVRSSDGLRVWHG